MQEKPHVMVLNYEYPPAGGGGGAASALLAKHLLKRGYRVTVQTGRAPGLPAFEEIDGVPVYRAFTFRRRRDRCSVFEMALFILFAFLPALRRIRKLKPDVLHVHFAVPTGALGWLLHRLTRVPYLLTVHLGDVPGAMPERTGTLFRLIKPFTVPIWRRAAEVVAVSGFIGDLSEKAYGLRPKLIYNGHEPPEHVPNRPSREVPKLFFAGRFDPQKNLMYMLDVLAQCKDLAWTMEFAGDGPLAVAFKKKAETLGLSERLTFHGWVHPREVDRLMADSDILLMTSFAEGLPVVAVRALSFGLAIAGSDIGGLHDVILENENGIRGPLGDPEGFSKKLRPLLISNDLRSRMSEKSQALAEIFDISKLTSQYEEIFSRLAASSIMRK